MPNQGEVTVVSTTATEIAAHRSVGRTICRQGTPPYDGWLVPGAVGALPQITELNMSATTSMATTAIHDQ